MRTHLMLASWMVQLLPLLSGSKTTLATSGSWCRFTIDLYPASESIKAEICDSAPFFLQAIGDGGPAWCAGGSWRWWGPIQKCPEQQQVSLCFPQGERLRDKQINCRFIALSFLHLTHGLSTMNETLCEVKKKMISVWILRDEGHCKSSRLLGGDVLPCPPTKWYLVLRVA